MNEEPAMLRARNVHKSFGGLEVLKGVDLDVERGKVVCLLGPSGSGKTTFLRCINYLERPSFGDIYVDGELIGYREHDGKYYERTERELNAQRSRIGMVFQRFNLFGHKSALENVIEGPMAVLGVSREKAVSEARELLARVGLADKANNYPNTLSGGQQQRVAIARALAMHPILMLFDEPTSALDPELVGDVLEVMRELARSGMTMVVVTHEIAFAREVADTVVFMDGGIVVEAGPPAQVIGDPQNSRTAQFLSKVG